MIIVMKEGRTVCHGVMVSTVSRLWPIETAVIINILIQIDQRLIKEELLYNAVFENTLISSYSLNYKVLVFSTVNS